MRLGDSKIFRECAGVTFTDAVLRSFNKNVCLIGVKNTSTNSIELNPGLSYKMVCGSFMLWLSYLVWHCGNGSAPLLLIISIVSVFVLASKHAFFAHDLG